MPILLETCSGGNKTVHGADLFIHAVRLQFATELGGVAPALLPAVLMLLRSKSREVIKAVLGFVKARGTSAPACLAMVATCMPAHCEHELPFTLRRPDPHGGGQCQHPESMMALHAL